MTRAPAFQAYANDLIALFVGLSPAATGSAIKLFLVMWSQSADQCSFIDDDAMLARTIGATLEEWKAARAEIQHPSRPLFEEKDDKLVSPYLRAEILKQRKYRKMQAEKSRKGVAARMTRGLPVGVPTGGARVTSSSSLSSSSSSSLSSSSPSSLHSSSKREKKEKKKEKSCSTAAPAAPAKSAATWSAYSAAYEKRYRVVPVSNAGVNAMLCRVVDKLGATEAPKVAAYFVTHNEPFYVKRRHPVELLLKDAEGLRTQWASGVTATTTEAREAERADNLRATSRQVDELLAKGICSREEVRS